MLLHLIYIIAGVALVLWGADRMTDGAVALAKKMNISEMVIGLTIVAMGTSAPELFVSLTSALQGSTDMAVGNVVGSNIFNTMLIVGAAALVAPMAIQQTTVAKDVPFTVLATTLLIVFCFDGLISRLEALLLCAIFVGFMVYTVKTGSQGGGTEASPHPTDTAALTAESPSTLKSVGFVALGLACLIVGSNLFVGGATEVAHTLGVSDAVIGLTVVAGGTSLPELATSVVAARKGQSSIAMGNVIGSNVFNILMILGITGIICPMPLHGITTVDLAMLLLSITLLWLFSFTKLTIERWEGAVLTTLFVGYMAWLVVSAIGATA